MRKNPFRTYVVGAAFGLVSCGGSVDGVGGTTASGNGGASNADNPATSLGGNQATGASSSSNTAGDSTGGASTGGTSATGGVATGGAATGGAATGGAATGGAAMGGAATGGAATGGTATGGAATGGRSATGGVAAGGATFTGGAATGGATTANTTTPDPCSTTSPLSGGIKHCSQSDSGSYSTYEWQVWSNQTGGCLTTYDNAGAAFSANWDNSGDFLARVGLIFDGTKTYQELGTFSADFAETHTGTAGGYSYIGIYGWTATPSVNFYIVEDAFDNSPPLQPGGGSNPGTIQVDGGTYDVYVYQTSHMTPPINEVYSIRRTKRGCGHISISDHFSKWASLGFRAGNMVEVDIFAEAGGGTGSIDFATASLTF